MPRRLAHGARQVDQLAEPLRLIVRRRGPRPAAQPSRCGSCTRRIAACSSSSRELWPTSSNVCLSREPWKRSIRTRSATAASRVVTAPPSPNAPRFLDGKNENVAAVPSAPGRPPSLPEPAACAASSSTGTPSASISATGATLPNRCTAITAFVRGVSAARTLSAVTQNVRGSTSQNTGRALSAGSPPPTRRT